MKLTQFEADAMQALINVAAKAQRDCQNKGNLMTASELRSRIYWANRHLRPDILEAVARMVETTIGIKIAAS